MAEKFEEPISPSEGKTFYSVAIEVINDDPETGKQKKQKEEHLVEGANVTEVETKVKDEMKFCTGDWKIVKCQTSKISIVY